MSEIYFEDYIAANKHHSKNVIIQVPLGCDKKIIYNTILKHSQLISKNHYLVTTETSLDEEDNGNLIPYEKLNQAYDENNNTIFFIDNIQIFTFYGSSLLSEAKNSNIFIFFLDIINVLQHVYKILVDYHHSIDFLYPKQFCIDVDIDYNIKKTSIGKEQYMEYRRRLLESEKMYETERIDISVPEKISGILNVYLDKVIPNFSSISVEYALQRAPKFKTIIVDLLLKNKNRHIVKMVDGLEGIDSFTSIYDKLDNTMKLVIIRSRESLSEKIKKIRSINHNNSPITILTDFSLVGKMTPTNISYYHITDGGDMEDLITIFDLLKSKNFNGVYSTEIEEKLGKTLSR